MLHLEIVTPENMIFSDTVKDIYLPGADGEIGVLSMHEALVTALAPGELRYEKDGVTHELAIGSGFAEITDEKVSVLTDMALGEHEIDEAAAEEAIKEAEESIAKIEIHEEPEEFAHLQALIAAKVAMLNLKRRGRP